MELFSNVLIQDLKAYIEGLENKDFQFCNIISNRVVTDAVFLESKEFALIGVILKNTLPDFQRVEESHEVNVRKKFITLINRFIGYQDRLDSSFILDRFSEFFDESKAYFTSSFEDYSENKDYTTKVINFCLEFLKNELEEDILPHSEHLLIRGVLNEISRASRQFGCTPHQHILQYILSFSYRLQDYFKVILSSNGINDGTWLERYKNYINLLKDNIQHYELSEEYINKCVDNLFELIKEWRFMFMRLMNIMPPLPQVPQDVKFPSRVENKLRDMVSKAISEELKGEEE